MVTHFLKKGLTKGYNSLLRTREDMASASGAIGASQRVFPPHTNIVFQDSPQPQSPGDCFPALEQRQPLLPRSPSAAEVTVGEGTSAPAREMTAVSQLEPNCV